MELGHSKLVPALVHNTLALERNKTELELGNRMSNKKIISLKFNRIFN